MAVTKISINLLPKEVLVLEKDKNRQKFFMRLAVGVLLVMIILTSFVFSLRIYQNQKFNQAAEELGTLQKNVESFREEESLAVYLKQRISSINTIVTGDSPQAKGYNLITQLVPSSIVIVSLNFDNNGAIILSAIAPDAQSAKDFFDKLVDPVANQGTVASAHLDSLSQGADSTYRMDVTIKTK